MNPHRNHTQKRLVWRKIAVYSTLFFLLGVAQCSFFNNLSFISAVPDIVLGAVVAVSMFDTQRTAVVCAIGAGAMIDAMGSSGISLCPVAFLIAALICSEISQKILPSFISLPLLLIPAALVKSAFTILNVYLMSSAHSFSVILKTILLPEFILTLIFSLPLFFIVKPCARLAQARSKFKV